MSSKWWLGCAIVALGVGSGCSQRRGTNLDHLVIQDSTYYEPLSEQPFSGPVYLPFRTDTTRIQLVGRLENGTWNGELTVYHLNGRIRYQGELADGARCGSWLENQDDEGRESLYEELVQEIESLSLYPPCPGS